MQEAADTWFGYPEQKHHMHLSQAYMLVGDTGSAYQAQEEALALTDSPSVTARALPAVDTAKCLRVDGDPTGAAEMAPGVWERLPAAYREGLIRSRTETLHRQLTGRPHALLGEARPFSPPHDRHRTPGNRLQQARRVSKQLQIFET
ncbi:hypothetical protein [Kitasatospora brasiliensis]|uniref:hypothetical protein n=1 Tax=Kitasatospora brasiliensis TaxID=3058040 RepID=UPI00292FF4F6|nr:hypothetical protein [Kitasatospora sp. K002]